MRPSRLHPRAVPWAVLGVLFLLSGCATDYVARTAGVRHAYESGNYDQALNELQKQEKQGHDADTLLYLMDQGMLLHAAGRYQDSIPVLARAEKLAQSLDITSVHEEAKTLLTGERAKWYRGEDFEHVMINVLQGLNYACIGKSEDAIVEERRVNEKLLKLINEEKKPFQQLAIARYLSAVLYEDQGKLDDAYIDYKKSLELNPGLGPLVLEPLLRIAQKTGRDQDVEAFTAQAPGLVAPPLGPDEGQVVVVIEEGLAPRKIPSDGHGEGQAKLITIPTFVDRGRAVPPVVALDGGEAQPAAEVTDLAAVAKLDLQDRTGKLLARQVAGAAVKAGLAAGVGALTKSKGLGVLTLWALSLGNQTDLRSWMSLPAQFDVARFRASAGSHVVRLSQQGRSLEQTVEVIPGRISLWVIRVY